MIIIGHPWIESPRFCKIFNIDEIGQTKSDEVVLLEPLNESYKIAQYCQKNGVTYAVSVNTLADALYANTLGASYILCEEDDASLIQPIANEYLFDTKVLALIYTEKEMIKISKYGIDGVIYNDAIC